MKRQRKSGISLRITLVLLCFACFSSSAYAGERWSYTLGGGIYSDAVYPGADEFYIVPAPIAQASYGNGSTSFYISMPNGIGLSWFSEEKGLTLSTSARYGQERDNEEYSVLGIMKDHSQRTKTLLADTPSVSAPVVYDATISYQALNGAIEASVEWYPTSVDYPLAGQQDGNFNGLISSLSYSLEDQLAEKLFFSGEFAIQYMNQGYADAWYTVRYPTSELGTFDSRAGLRDIAVSMQLTRMLSPKTGLSLLGTATLLMEDAARSPYTTRKFQHSTLLMAFYNF